MGIDDPAPKANRRDATGNPEEIRGMSGPARFKGGRAKGVFMKVFVWRHSKLYSSWSMFDEPHICRHNYMQAEVVVLADTVEEALALLEGDDTWNIEELKRIEPIVHNVEQPAVVTKVVFSG